MARTDSLGHFLTDVADAIRTKGGTSATIQASNFDTAIANLPSGGGTTEVESKDVDFYDYDGTRIYSYTKTEFLALESMPSNPTHEGLTAQGWNWTLSDAQTFVTTYGKMDIGQFYVTDDEATRIYIDLIDETRLNPYIGLYLNTTITIDWGDDSTPDTITGTSTSNVTSTNHVYSSVGKYVISITGGKLYLTGGSNSQSSMLFTNNQITTQGNSSTNPYLDYVYKIELGSNVNGLGYASFGHLHNLKSISVPSIFINVSSTHAFYHCHSLKYVTYPKAYSISAYGFDNCVNLKAVSFSDTTRSVNPNSFSSCYVLKRVIFPNALLLPQQAMFQYCYSLIEFIKSGNEIEIPFGFLSYCTSFKKYIAPSTLTKINNIGFSNCSGITEYDFTALTSVPTLASTSAFTDINPNCRMIIPDDLYDTWSTASNWSSYASYMVKESEI